MLRRNTARQPNSVASAPPTTGPAAAATPMDAVRTAIGVRSRSGGYAARSIPSVAGCNSAPNTPCTIRSPITQPTSGASAMPADAAPKPSMPRAKVRRCP